MTATTKHVYEVTTAVGHKERIRAARFDIVDQIVVFDAKNGGKGGKGGVAAFPVNQLDSVVRADITSRSGRRPSSKKTSPKARSNKTTSTRAATERGPRSSNGKLATRSSNLKPKSRAKARRAR